MGRTVTIMTSKRPVMYLEQTVKTIPKSFDVEYVVQGDVKVPRPGMITKVHRLYAKDETRHRDAGFNYAMALLSTSSGFIIEDDIIFCKNFEMIYENMRKQLPEGKYAIALYACYNWGANQGILAKYPVDDFYGTQAMVYDKKTAENFGEYLLGNLETVQEPYDMALKRFIKEIDPEVKLYATTLSLVQHMGTVSTGLGNGHQTSNFVDDIII